MSDEPDESDDGTGQLSSEETRGMPTERQKAEWERGDEDEPQEEAEREDDGEEIEGGDANGGGGE